MSPKRAAKKAIKKAPTRNYTKLPKPVRYLIVHCSDTYPEMDWGWYEIDELHRGKGWSGGGYHFVIKRDGVVERGRPEDMRGAHTLAKGRNMDSLGICMIGGKSRTGEACQDNFTEAQKNSLLSLSKRLNFIYPSAQFAGHRSFANRGCPCFDFETFYLDAGLPLYQKPTN